MIEFTKAYRVGDRTFATVTQAQTVALVALGLPENVATVIVSKSFEVMDILTVEDAKPASKKPRKPRSDIGKKREASPSTPATAAA